MSGYHVGILHGLSKSATWAEAPVVAPLLRVGKGLKHFLWDVPTRLAGGEGIVTALENSSTPALDVAEGVFHAGADAVTGGIPSLSRKIIQLEGGMSNNLEKVLRTADDVSSNLNKVTQIAEGLNKTVTSTIPKSIAIGGLGLGLPIGAAMYFGRGSEQPQPKQPHDQEKAAGIFSKLNPLFGLNEDILKHVAAAGKQVDTVGNLVQEGIPDILRHVANADQTVTHTSNELLKHVAESRKTLRTIIPLSIVGGGLGLGVPVGTAMYLNGHRDAEDKGKTHALALRHDQLPTG